MKRSGGFTPVNLVIVIVLLGFLAGFLIPSYLEFQKRRACPTCQNEAQTTVMEKAIVIAPNDCNIGINNVPAPMIADFLNKHADEFTVLPGGRYGVLIHRKSCDTASE